MSDQLADHQFLTAATGPFDLAAGPERPLLRQLVDRAAEDPGALAAYDGDRRRTRAEVLADVAALAAVIRARIPPRSPVGVRLPDGVDAPIAWLACLAAGCPAVLLDHTDAPERFATIASTSRLAAVISDQPAPGYDVISPSGHPAAPLSIADVPQGAPAFVVWTSGSTGLPKGIVQSQRSVLFRAGLLIDTGRLGPADRYLSLNAPASMGALLNAVAAFLSGACLHRVDIGRHGLNGVLDRIERSRITALIGVPALYRALCQIDGAAALLTSLRLASSNGDALLAADLAQLRAVLPATCDIQMIYGATETQAAMRIVPRDEIPQTPQVPAGAPLAGVDWVIVDDNGLPVPRGEVGELWIRSRYTAIGEWVDGRCVPGRLLPDGPDGVRRYAMGDLVRMNSAGDFVVVGRKDRQLKLDGHRIEPVEIEAALRAEPDVVDAAVLPLARGTDWCLVAFVAAAAGSPDGLAGRLRTALAARLPAAMRPRTIHVLDRLPLLPGNKIDADALRRIDADARR